MSHGGVGDWVRVDFALEQVRFAEERLQDAEPDQVAARAYEVARRKRRYFDACSRYAGTAP
ncbi:MAG: hypothetical protein ACLQVI_22400 [Polyangiaceae bacterium]